MSTSLYDLSVGSYLQVLRSVVGFLEKGAEHCAENGFPLINLNPAFEREKNKARLFFPDHYHPSPDGAAFIASQVTDALIPIIAAELPENRTTSVFPRIAQTTNGLDTPKQSITTKTQRHHVK